MAIKSIWLLWLRNFQAFLFHKAQEVQHYIFRNNFVSSKQCVTIISSCFRILLPFYLHQNWRPFCLTLCRIQVQTNHPWWRLSCMLVLTMVQAWHKYFIVHHLREATQSPFDGHKSLIYSRQQALVVDGDTVELNSHGPRQMQWTEKCPDVTVCWEETDMSLGNCSQKLVKCTGWLSIRFSSWIFSARRTSSIL